MADVERVEIRRTEGTTDRSGAWTVIGIILGLVIVAGVAAFILAGPQIQAWWGDNGGSPAASTTHSSTVVTDGGSSTTSTTQSQ